MLNRTTRTVDVAGLDTPLYFIDAAGTTQPLGNIRAEIYGKDEAQRFVFYPSLQSPVVPDAKKGGEYVLGTGSARMGFISPHEAQQVLLDHGYSIKQQFSQRGGLQITTHYIKEMEAVDDPFTYDKRFWSWRPAAERDGKIYHAVQLATDLRIGHMAARYVPGWYRTVCTNGLFAQILGTNWIDARHSDWDLSDLHNRLEEELIPTFDFGPVLTKGKFLRSATRLIKRYQAEVESGKMSPEMEILEKQFTGLSRTTLYSWAVNGYLTQLNLLLEELGDEDDVRGVHLVNAYTSSVNNRRIRISERGIFSALESTNNVVRTTVALANLAAIFIV